MGWFSRKKRTEKKPETRSSYSAGSALAAVEHAHVAQPEPVHAPQKRPRRQRVKAVQVAFRTPAQARYPLPKEGYTYKWRLRDVPDVGDWVIVPGFDGHSLAVIVALDAGVSAKGLSLSSVARMATPSEISQFLGEVDALHAAKKRDEADWLDMARAKAGLPVARKLPARVPSGFDAIPPKSGTITGQRAKDRGRVWWKIYKRAQEARRPADELAAFKSIADFWYSQGRAK